MQIPQLMRASAVMLAMGALSQAAMAEHKGHHGSCAAAQLATLSVSGEGERSISPDLAVISLGVTTRAATAQAAMAENNNRQSAVIATLTEAGIAARDIQTSQLELSPVMRYRDNEAPVVEGYRAGNRVTVRLRDLERLGVVLDQIIGAGANEMNGISFQREDSSDMQDEARADAVRDAHRRAMVMAEAAGVQLGRILSISDGTRPQPMPDAQPMMMGRAAMSAESVPIAQGELTLRAQASVVWEIAQPSGCAHHRAGKGQAHHKPQEGHAPAHPQSDDMISEQDAADQVPPPPAAVEKGITEPADLDGPMPLPGT